MTRCLDCPSSRTGCFSGEVREGGSTCRFVKATVEARAPLPREWSEHHAFALVRRGVIVRTRAEPRGASIAIDCAGPGTVLPLRTTNAELGYAATQTLVCLYPRRQLQQAMLEDRELSREVLEGLEGALERVERLAEARGHGMAEQRMARVLAVLADTVSPAMHRDRLHDGIQQRDLARLAGVRHESVCRFLGKLERAETIRRHDGVLFVDRPERLSSDLFAHPLHRPTHPRTA